MFSFKIHRGTIVEHLFPLEHSCCELSSSIAPLDPLCGPSLQYFRNVRLKLCYIRNLPWSLYENTCLQDRNAGSTSGWCLETAGSGLINFDDMIRTLRIMGKRKKTQYLFTGHKRIFHRIYSSVNTHHLPIIPLISIVYKLLGIN